MKTQKEVCYAYGSIRVAFLVWELELSLRQNSCWRVLPAELDWPHNDIFGKRKNVSQNAALPRQNIENPAWSSDCCFAGVLRVPWSLSPKPLKLRQCMRLFKNMKIWVLGSSVHDFSQEALYFYLTKLVCR